MDPNACVERMLQAYDANDYDEAQWAAHDLNEWLQRGGFQPMNVSRRAMMIFAQMQERNLLKGMPQ